MARSSAGPHRGARPPGVGVFVLPLCLPPVTSENCVHIARTGAMNRMQDHHSSFAGCSRVPTIFSFDRLTRWAGWSGRVGRAGEMSVPIATPMQPMGGGGPLVAVPCFNCGNLAPTPTQVCKNHRGRLAGAQSREAAEHSRALHLPPPDPVSR